MIFHLILGGARSGKSRYAEQQASQLEHQLGEPVVYLATATAQDEEMAARIAHHRASRPAHWHCYEAPLQLASALQDISQRHPDSPIVLDCLTLWLTNCLLADEQNLSVWRQERQALLNQLAQLSQPLLTVSNEVGWGIVPMGEINRRFIDEAGRLHQELAQLASQVTLVVAGLPQKLKG